MVIGIVSVYPLTADTAALVHPVTTVAAPVMPVMVRAAVVYPAAVAVAGTVSRNIHLAIVGAFTPTVTAPAVEVERVLIVAHDVDPYGARCTLTDRWVNEFPVLTRTAVVKVYPVVADALVVDHPDTDVAASMCVAAALVDAVAVGGAENKPSVASAATRRATRKRRTMAHPTRQRTADSREAITPRWASYTPVRCAR